jgi:hypothetical protein
MTDTMADRKADSMAQEPTPFRRIRLDDDLWKRLDEAAKAADPDSNRSVLIRKFARWYVGDIDEMPQRPPRRAEGAISEARALDNAGGGQRSQVQRHRQDPAS